MKIREERLQKLLDSVADYVYKVYINDNKDVETIHGERYISIMKNKNLLNKYFNY